ncbi:DUF4291 domain-containing protein, partial [Streptomyces albidoflavus]|uniref:DUF4291 domain-containing protein n=1 Tax=Streptomyces albidoflavus TaxID=1886 RepID=UPI00211C7890
LTVYQAYPPSIALPTAQSQRFPPAWKRDRMTWIKPSFLWMMYRSGWSRKEGQERVLAIEISREGFDWALAHACLSAYHPDVHADRDAWRAALRGSPARVQWDPERDWRLQPLPYRALQLGLSGEAVRRYADEWLVSVVDVTGLAHASDAADARIGVDLRGARVVRGEGTAERDGGRRLDTQCGDAAVPRVRLVCWPLAHEGHDVCDAGG